MRFLVLRLSLMWRLSLNLFLNFQITFKVKNIFCSLEKLRLFATSLLERKRSLVHRVEKRKKLA